MESSRELQTCFPIPSGPEKHSAPSNPEGRLLVYPVHMAKLVLGVEQSQPKVAGAFWQGLLRLVHVL